MTAPTTIPAPAAHEFRATLAQLAAGNDLVLHRALSALVDQVCEDHPNEDAQQLIFNDLLNVIDPYWMVKTS